MLFRSSCRRDATGEVVDFGEGSVFVLETVFDAEVGEVGREGRFCLGYVCGLVQRDLGGGLSCAQHCYDSRQ